MKGSLAAWLSSWSKQTPRKSRYITSTTGRMPAMAAPTPSPTIGGLGDRRVADPVAEALAQPPGQAEHVAALADVDRRPGRPARRRPARPRARRGRRPWCGTTGASAGGAGGSACCGPGRARRSRRACSATARAQSRAPARRRSSSSASTDDSSRVDLVVVDAGLEQPAPVHDQRVALLPLRHLLGRPVALGVALVVTVPAVGGRLDEDGSAAARAACDDVAHGRRPWRRRRCRRRRRRGARSRRPAVRATPRAASASARTPSSRCSRRRRSPAAATPRPG